MCKWVPASHSVKKKCVLGALVLVELVKVAGVGSWGQRGHVLK